jgi:hypothetical protein
MQYAMCKHSIGLTLSGHGGAAVPVLDPVLLVPWLNMPLDQREEEEKAAEEEEKAPSVALSSNKRAKKSSKKKIVKGGEGESGKVQNTQAPHRGGRPRKVSPETHRGEAKGAKQGK